MSAKGRFASSGKKILFLAAAIALVAAGCGSSKTPPPNATTGTTPTALTPPVSQAQPPVQTQTTANVKVNSSDDAVNLIEKASTNEQAQVSAGDDSDLVTSDSSDLDSLKGAANGY